MATECTPVVGANCDEELPEVEFSICDPEVHFGEIDRIFVTNVGNPLTDETSAVEWAARLAATDDTKILELSVIAEKPAPEETEVPISRGRTVNGQKGHSVIGEIHETNKTNYNFHRSCENGKNVLAWYTTRDGHLFGGPTGITATLKMIHIIPKSNKDLQVYNTSLKWDAKNSPCIATSPI